MQDASYSSSRREFLKGCGCAALGAAGMAFGSRLAQGALVPGSVPGVPIKATPALYWERLPDGDVRCLLCPHACQVRPGQRGRCFVRENRDGALYVLTYGTPCVLCEDPLAKNPLNHVSPGASALGVGMAGCNLGCSYCHSWDMAQTGPEGTRNMSLTPAEVVAKAEERQVKWLTFSYTEPVVSFEYTRDIAAAAGRKGLRTAMATAGYINPAPLAELLRHTDVFTVTLKGATEAFYRDTCLATLRPVWDTIRTIVKSGRWLEVATLVVPGVNDDPAELKSMAKSLAELNPDIPLHYLRFRPAYRLKTLPPTPLATLEKAREGAREAGLRFVYIDVAGHSAANTLCPGCGTVLIARAGYSVVKNVINRGACPGCRRPVPGVLPG